MNTSIDFTNNVTSAEADEMIESIVRTIMADSSMSSKMPPVMLRGSPGIGKSAIVHAIAERLNIGFIDIRLAQQERVDFCGLPSVENNVTSWNVPNIWPNDMKSKGIIFLDEITSAPPDVQVAAYQLVLDRCISNSKYKLPDGWYIIAAGNNISDRAVVKTMSSALANRFMHLNMNVNAEDWNIWAVTADIHPSVTGFIQFRPGLLFKMDDQNLEAGWPSPRAWEKVSNIIKQFGDNIEMARKMVYGLVGPAAGLEFIEFYKSSKSMADVVEMLSTPGSLIKLPEKTDEKCAFSAAVVYYLWKSKDEEGHAVRVDNLFRILDKMTPDFVALIVKSASAGNASMPAAEAIKHISMCKRYPEFAKSHMTAFSKRYTLD